MLPLRSTSISTAYIDGNAVYQRCNTSQINKVRCFIRKQKYQLNPKIKNQHINIDGKYFYSLCGLAETENSGELYQWLWIITSFKIIDMIM